ncbi:MAG: hypothetical protein IPN90_07010 [Elusimicrobia bacterium]|nr:hypothetical protein [Elusimicrobiota bacterium]
MIPTNCNYARPSPFGKGVGLGLAIWFLTSGAFAKVRVETSLEPREGTVGDLLVLQLKTVAEAPGNCRVDVGGTVGAFEVVQFSTAAEQRNGSLVERDFTITLALFDVGVSTLPALTVRCQEQAQTVEVKTPEIPVTIKSVLTPESKDIRGLKGYLKKVPNWPVILSLLAFLLVIGGIVVWVKFGKGKGGRRPPPGPPPVAPHVRALEDLRRLEEELTAPAKVFYSQLTDILRAYLEGAFDAPAMDRTTAEIFVELKSLSITIDQRLGLRAVLEDGDLAKFAKLEPTEEERLNDFQRVRDFVLATKPDEENLKADGRATKEP